MCSAQSPGAGVHCSFLAVAHTWRSRHWTFALSLELGWRGAQIPLPLTTAPVPLQPHFCSQAGLRTTSAVSTLLGVQRSMGVQRTWNETRVLSS